jgi:hypothetical protein
MLLLAVDGNLRSKSPGSFVNIHAGDTGLVVGIDPSVSLVSAMIRILKALPPIVMTVAVLVVDLDRFAPGHQKKNDPVNLICAIVYRDAAITVTVEAASFCVAVFNVPTLCTHAVS